MYSLPCFYYADFFSCVTDVVLWYAENLAEVLVREAVLLSLGEVFS